MVLCQAGKRCTRLRVGTDRAHVVGIAETDQARVARPITEEWPLEPKRPYPQSKVAAEMVVRLVQRQDHLSREIRPVLGPGEP
jgi:nucleoside-diphosphate-sugar epimerase